MQLSPPEDEHIIARKMQRYTIDLIKKLCIKLEKKLHFTKMYGQQYIKKIIAVILFPN